MVPVLFETHLNSLPLLHKGKVRDIYAVDNEHMLIVTTDRLSAFDVILPTAIPGKGKILTEVSNFWFSYFSDTIPNQLSAMTLEQAIPDTEERALVEGRAIVVKRLKSLPIEAIVRGYIIGSGWRDYQASGSICGIKLPAGLQLADKLPDAIYTPSSKAAVGEHDENIDYAATAALIGEDLAQQIKTVSLKLYKEAAAYALSRGIAKELAFAWWIPYMMKKRDRIIAKINTQYHKTTHKFGIELPKNLEHARRLDEASGTTLCTYFSKLIHSLPPSQI